MSLTKKEIEKIEEEERVRLEARLRYTKKEENVKKKTTSLITWLFTIFIIFAIILFVSNQVAAGTFVFGAVMVLILYFLPSIVGHEKKNADAILILNLFLGWTLIGWIVALVWATAKD